MSDTKPIGYAVRMATGPFVGIWHDQAIAEHVRSKQHTGQNDEVIPVVPAADLEAAIAAKVRAEAALLCPGQMRCAKCKFELTRRTMYVQSGTIGAGTSETEPCPNGCGPLWPVTWEQEARSCYASLDRLFDEKQKAEAERDALAARVAALEADGMMLVPKIPTYEMVQAGAKLVSDNMPYHTGTRAIYIAMLDATLAREEKS